jgi:DNA-binding beta-propeller fold protein YncE
MGADMAINHDGSRVYVASSSPNAFTVHDGQTLSLLPSLAADSSPNAVKVGPDNRLYGTASTRYGAKDLWAYDNSGNLQGSYRLAAYSWSVLTRQLKASGDGKRFVVLTDEPNLKFATGQ